MFEQLKDLLSKHHHIVILSQGDYQRTLDEMATSHLFCNAKLMRVPDLYPVISNGYYKVLNDKYHISPMHADKIKPYLGIIDETTDTLHPDILQLIEIQKYLENLSLIRYPSKALLDNKKIFLYHLEEDVPLLRKWNIPYEMINDTFKQENPVPIVKSFDYQKSLYEVAETVAYHLEKGVIPEKIHIIHVTSEDQYQLSKYFNEAKIAFQYLVSKPLLNHPVGIEFLKLAKESTVSDAFKWLSSEVTMIEDLPAKVVIYRVLNHYHPDGIEDDKEYFLYELEKATIQPKKIANAIQLHPEDTVPLQDDEVGLILNFSDEQYPSKYIDDDYLSDELKSSVSLITSIEQNGLIIKHTQEYLTSSKNIILFHYQRNESLEYHLSFDKILFNIFDKNPYRSIYRTYPNQQLLLGRLNEENRKIYSPHFKSITQDLANQLVGKKIHLSQTSLNIYFECRFHYLLNYLLKLDNFETTFYLFYGNVIHKMIEMKSNNLEIDYPSLFEAFRKDFNVQEAYKWDLYLPILEEKLSSLHQVLDDVSFQGEIKPYLAEESVKFTHPIDDRFIMLGKIDQTYLYQHKGKNYVVIVDYKTGDTSFNYEDTISLKQIQLLMYYYLFLHHEDPDNFIICGMYYQQVHIKRLQRKDGIQGALSSFSYDGITVLDDEVTHFFVTNAKIKAVKEKKDGSMSESKRLFKKDEMNLLINRLEERIRLSIEEISKGEFEIDPYPVMPGKKESKSCQYCKFKNICYLSNSIKSDNLDDETEMEDDEYEI